MSILFEDDLQQSPLVSPHSEEDSDLSQDEEDLVVQATTQGDGEDVPIPELHGEEHEQLNQFTLSDPTLQSIRDWAYENKQGYSWQDRLLISDSIHEVYGTLSRIVVPKDMRERILTLAHDFSGHLGVAKLK